MTTITQEITPLPTPPTITDPASFATRADAFVVAQAEMAVELETFRGQVNTVAGEVSDNAEAAVSSAAAATGAANFAGEWDDLTGPLAIPASVSHNSRVWLLLQDLADVTAEEPEEGAFWFDMNQIPTSPTFTGTITFDGSIRTPVDAVGALDIDCSVGTSFSKTVAGASAFTFSNPPASGIDFAFKLKVTHTSGAITWPAAVIWPGGAAPTLTTSKVHLFWFATDDGGTTWRAAALVNYAS